VISYSAWTLGRMSDHVVGVDLGGSNVRVVLGHISRGPVADIAAPTAQGEAQAVVAQLASLSRQLAETAGVDWSRIAGMAVGVPGVAHVDGSELRLAPNLPPFADIDVATALGAQLGVPVVVDNDVNMATLAEQRHGLGVGASDFVFIAVGTGVGMGIVASERLQRGATGAAGEIGFLPLGLDPFERDNQRHGPLEEAGGGVGVARRYAALAGSAPDAVAALEVYARAAAGDRHARTVLDDQARALALAVVSVQSMLDPALVVFGGGIGSRKDFVARVRAYVARLTPRHVRIEVSGLGERAGLIGAAELARAQANGELPADRRPALREDPDD
jgi:predicted NBD/HSP70 family sugar kinase